VSLEVTQEIIAELVVGTAFTLEIVAGVLFLVTFTVISLRAVTLFSSVTTAVILWGVSVERLSML
jgi:hypothetical protein